MPSSESRSGDLVRERAPDIGHYRVELAGRVHFGIFLILFVLGPPLFILLQSVNTIAWLVHLWNERRQLLEKRHDNKSNEAWLRPGHLVFLAIAEHAYRQAKLFFDVALLEELFEEEIHPFLNNLKRPALLRNICRMNRKVHDLLLTLEQFQLIYFVPILIIQQPF